MIIKKHFIFVIAFCLAIALLVFATLVYGAAKEVNLTWEASPTPEVTGYNVYYDCEGTETPFEGTGALPPSVDAGNLTALAIDGIPEERACWFAATAYTAESESPRSNLIYSPAVIVPVIPEPPVNLEINAPPVVEPPVVEPPVVEPPVVKPPAISKGLIQGKDLVYQGAFRVPKGNLGGDSKRSSMGRGGAGIAYNPARNSLIMSGSMHERLAVEISIPNLVVSENIGELNFAEVVQVPIAITDRKWDNLNTDGSAVGNGGSIGGFLVYKDKLIGNAYPYYAPGDEGRLTHYTASLNWAQDGSMFSGWKRVGINPSNPSGSSTGWVGGYMGHVPPEWQERLGWPALTGNGAIAIVSRSSFGPSLSGFNPDDIGNKDPAPTEIFFGYPDSHQTLGTYTNGHSLFFNSATNLSGVVFPEGTDSVLIFGKHGLGMTGEGDSCYGTGASDISLHREPNGQGGHWCYDPVNSTKGGHAYPYVTQIWAYDANDFLDVKSGKKQYWEVVPYARIELDLPFIDETSSRTGRRDIGGAAYDPATQRIFIPQSTADHLADYYEPNPIIHVFKVNLAK